MIYLSNEPYPQEISVPRSFGVIVPQRNTYLSTADIAADLTTDSDTKVLAASQGVALKAMVDAKADASDVYNKQEVDAELALKADADDVYTKQEVDGALAEKADASDIPTKTSDLTNDSGFVTGQEVSQTYETKSDATAKETALQNAINRKQDILTFDNVPTNGSSNPVKSDGIYDALATKQPNISDLQTIRSGAAAGATAVQPAELQTELSQKQDRLISGQNIKTINNTSLLGSGNIVIQGGGSDPEAVKFTPQTLTDAQKEQARTNIGAGTYSKPSDGIPATDLAEGVIPSVPVQDVEVDGVSVLNDGVAEIPAIPTTYAGSATAGGAADKALGIPYGEVDSDSTATDIKASVDNFPTTLVAGVCAYIRNDVVSSASGFTLNINGTGAKPVYASNADASRVTTLFSAATTFLFVYNPTRVSGGCWDMYYGYNANDNTIGYMLRTNGAVPPTASKFYRYRLLFTSDDNQSLIPANTSSSTNATAARAVNQAKINPFAPIYYYSNTTAVDAGVSPGASYVWLQYSGITLGYSFNRTGSALTMTAKDPVFLKCAPQADGSAIMDADTPIVQALPSTEDGNIYIYLGIAESATAITLYYWHPIYWYKDGAIRQWTNAKEIVVDSVPTQGSTNPVSSGGVKAALDGKQDTLESGVNIKTINNQSLLGSGNIDIQGGGKSIEDVSSADVTLAAQVGKSYIWSVIPTSMNIQLPANPADGSEIEMRFFTGSKTLPTISFGSTRILWPGGEISLMLDAVHLLKFNYSALGGWACDCLVCYSPFPALPEGYTAYLWIGKTTGTGYINTGYAPKTKPRVTTSLMKIGAIPDADLFGSNGSPLFIFNPGQTAAGNVLFSFYYKYGNKSSGNITGVTFNEFVWYDVDAKEDITFGGQLYSWATEWDYSSNSANIFIFGGRNFSGSNIRMKRTRIYDGDTLVRDLCPCTDPDGNPGMYDLVTEAFYGCAIAGQPLEVGN